MMRSFAPAPLAGSMPRETDQPDLKPLVEDLRREVKDLERKLAETTPTKRRGSRPSP
jgi:hypothetical protein